MTVKEKISKKKVRLEMYYTAEETILGGAQSYSMGTRSLTRANLAEIRNMISVLEDEIQELENLEKGKKPRKAFAVVPRDF
ncbi:DUF6148 family protein [Lachnotalea glycerini]|uniref:Uncharacterized protein n=1 Tax=Lachnotalea glycerini TaxID=1763509 RepID=A0A371J7K6_9FIRM|nr:DUF6148 family protein [Lachnotalea glycerini]RDY28646.1 hypothetical protein CG710_019250 [Lachnotalea glycerini]